MTAQSAVAQRTKTTAIQAEILAVLKLPQPPKVAQGLMGSGA